MLHLDKKAAVSTAAQHHNDGARNGDLHAREQGRLAPVVRRTLALRRGFPQVIRNRATLTSNWNRRVEPHDYESEDDAKAPSSSGETFEGVEAFYIHGEEAVAEVAEDFKEGIRKMVAVNLLPRTVWQIVYGVTRSPRSKYCYLARRSTVLHLGRTEGQAPPNGHVTSHGS